ncbi:FUSC family protein [Stenotrophomonas sp. CD2]|nr:FUSC family protein [Stenotrophomonas sp. CD2]
MGTVYIVSQPLLGPTRAKGVYRIVGTLVAGRPPCWCCRRWWKRRWC